MSLKLYRHLPSGIVVLQALALGIGVSLTPTGAQADDTLEQFMAALEPKSSEASEFFRHVFGDSKPIANEASPESNAPVSNPRTILLADVDPNFARWQRDANERLKHEQARSTPKQHPLAAAHPAKSVVVCEAGCGTTTADSIVYIEPVVPAVLPVVSSDVDGVSDPAAATLADGELPCIAGCYARTSVEVSGRRNEQSRANDSSSGGETSFVLTATSPRTQAGQNGGIVDAPRAPRRITAMSASDFYDGWRTKIVFPRSSRNELPGRAWQRQGVRHDRILISEYPD